MKKRTKPQSGKEAQSAKKATRRPRRSPLLPKAPTGIQGLDELAGGGLPKGRPTLLFVRQRRLRQDVDGHGVPRSRRGGVRRAGRLHGL